MTRAAGQVRPRRDLATPLAALGLALAFVGFARTFRGPRHRFWQRMTLNGAVLGGVSLAAARELPRLAPRALDVPLGLTSAGVLYIVFTIGDHVARRVMPSGATDIDDIYRLREQRPAVEIAARLVAVIGPAEELFWRGLLQGVLMRRLGRWRGAAAAAVAYAAVHLTSANLTLTGAAGTAGAFWSGLRAAGVSLPALVVSHVAWDVWIFLVAPTSRASAPASRRAVATRPLARPDGG